MKNKFSTGITILLWLSLLISCHSDRERLYPFGWTATEHASDSLLVKLDRNVMSYGDPGDLVRLADEYCRLSEKEDPEGLYNHRRLYWQGTALFMNGDFEKGDSLRREALAQCDSTRFPRDFCMYRMATEQPTDFENNISRYNRYSSDLSLFLSHDDPASAFTRAVQLSNLMTEAGMHDTAIKYSLMADSLLREADLPILRANNKVNIASCQFAAGDTVSAVSTLRELGRSSAASNPTMRAIIDFNIHQMCGDTVALRRTWDIVKDNKALIRMRPLVAAAMVKEGMFSKNPDEVENARQIIELSEDYAYLPEEEMYMAEAECDLALQNNNPKRLAMTMRKYQERVKKHREELKRNELVRAETSRQIRAVELNAELRRIRYQRYVWVAISIFVFLLGTAAFMILRYVGRLKRLKLLRQLESERLRRSKLSLELSLTEKEGIISSLQSKINELVRNEKLLPATATALEKTLSEEREMLDTERDADFIQKFMTCFPKVGKTGRRLALFISRGMDTSQIATAMNIRKESVIQGRWRLRNQMQLKSEEDLDIVIHTLLNRLNHVEKQ